MKHQALDGGGLPINPGDGVVPIMKETGKGRLSVIGTGFYITRYGLFVSARHVVESLVDHRNKKLGVAYVCHLAGDNGVYLRRIVAASLLNPFDLAVCQADNYSNKYPSGPLMNMRVRLTTEVPSIGSSVVTYAYPENEPLDFIAKKTNPTIVGDYYEGEILGHIIESNNPLMPYPHFETSIELKSGASGGPVFDSVGRVIGVNCSGWNFEGQQLSFIVPIAGLLDLRVELKQLPETSWEQAQIPEHRLGTAFTIGELAELGHVDFQPNVTPS